MKKITPEEFEALKIALWSMPALGYEEFSSFMEHHWSRIQEAQSSEPMSWEDVEDIIKPLMTKEQYAMNDFEGVRHSAIVAKGIAPYTSKQGFIPDWSKAPEWCVGWRPTWERRGVVAPWVVTPFEYCAGPFVPRPTPKTRERTVEELIAAWVSEYNKKNNTDAGAFHLSKLLASGHSLKWLCETDNISLTCEVG